MNVLQSHINTESPEFKQNDTAMRALVADLRDRTAAVKEGGGAKYMERHRAQGKLPVRERIAKLIFDQAREAGFPVVRVTVWETPTSFAEFRA